MFIDSTYFKGLLNIPTNMEGISEQLSDYITAMEKKYLTYALGEELYNSFITGLSEPVIEQKWLNLRDGASYSFTDNDGITRTFHWNGLKNADKNSFLANFTYCEFVQDNFETFNTAFTRNIAENTNNTDPSQRLIKAYRQGLDLYGFLPVYDLNFDLSDTTIGIYYYFWHNIRPNVMDVVPKNNLFNFIYRANEVDRTTYPNWVFTEISKPNFLGF